MIDPGIWTDPAVLRLSSVSVLVFIGMISHADDEGIIEAEPDSLYFRLARKDITSDMIKSSLVELAGEGLIYRYGVYAYFPNWFKHQNLKGRKPQRTKLRRPPEAALNEDYVSEWIETFAKNSDSPVFPVNTCYKTLNKTETTSESPVSHQCATSESPVSHQCATSESPVTPEVKGSEVKGSEVKGSEYIPSVAAEEPPPANGKTPPSPQRSKKQSQKQSNESGPGTGIGTTDPLYHAVKDSFLAKNPSGFTNWGKEGTAIKGILEKCSRLSPEEPEDLAEKMIRKLWELKSSGERFYRDQPFLPSTLNSSGIWDRVAEKLRDSDEDTNAAELFSRLDPFRVNGLRASPATG
jgi:hypothetical protein